MEAETEVDEKKVGTPEHEEPIEPEGEQASEGREAHEGSGSADVSGESSEEEDRDELMKLDADMQRDILREHHPEIQQKNYKEILALSKIVRDAKGIIIDPLHKTVPFMTKYERARVLGVRSRQLNSGAEAFIDVPNNIIDGFIIAKMELEQKKIPFIIRRPLPNGESEYWKLE